MRTRHFQKKSLKQSPFLHGRKHGQGTRIEVIGPIFLLTWMYSFGFEYSQDEIYTCRCAVQQKTPYEKKKKWKTAERQALVMGMRKHAASRTIWKDIKQDAEFAELLKDREPENLKDKMRNLQKKAGEIFRTCKRMDAAELAQSMGAPSDLECGWRLEDGWDALLSVEVESLDWMYMDAIEAWYDAVQASEAEAKKNLQKKMSMSERKRTRVAASRPTYVQETQSAPEMPSGDMAQGNQESTERQHEASVTAGKETSSSKRTAKVRDNVRQKEFSQGLVRGRHTQNQCGGLHSTAAHGAATKQGWCSTCGHGFSAYIGIKLRIIMRMYAQILFFVLLSRSPMMIRVTLRGQCCSASLCAFRFNLAH